MTESDAKAMILTRDDVNEQSYSPKNKSQKPAPSQFLNLISLCLSLIFLSSASQ